MSRLLKVLILEGSEDGAKFLIEELLRGGYDLIFERVYSADTMSAALDKQSWDIIIADYSMPAFDGLAALTLVKEKGFDIPFIIVSDVSGEDVAVSAIKAGANDYLMKNNLERLVFAVEQGLWEIEVQRERKKAVDALKLSEKRYRELIENANEGIAVIQDGKFTFFNRKFIEVLGPVEAVKSNSFKEFIHSEDQQMVMNYHMKRLNGEPSPKMYSCRVIDYEGNIRWVEVHANMITWEERPAILTYLSDITEKAIYY